MKRSKWAFVFCLIVSSTMSCNNNSNDEREEEPTNPQTIVQPETKELLPLMSREFLMELVEKCDHIDIIYYNSPVSISQTNKQTIMATLRALEAKPISLNDACQPEGRVIYSSQGEIMIEANLFLKPPCQYLLFYDGDQLVCGNAITSEGIQFFEALQKRR